MYINRRRLKKKAKRNKWFRLLRVIGIELGLSIVFLSFLLIVFHKQTKSLLNPLVHVRDSIASALGASDATPEIQRLLDDKHISYSAIYVASQSAYIVTLNDDSTVVLTSEHDLGGQISSLQVILNQLTMEGKRFTRLDLRFQKPVIVAK